MVTGAALRAGRRVLLGREAGFGSVQLPGTMAVLAAGDGGLLGRATSSGLVSRRPTSCLGRRPTDGKRTSAPSAGPADMNRGGIGVGAVAGEGCGAGERVGAGRGRAWAQPQAFLPLRPWGWGRESGSPLVAAASQNPPGRAGGGPILDEAGPYPGFEEPQNQMLEWGGLSALFICREISVPSRCWFLQSTSGIRHKGQCR